MAPYGRTQPKALLPVATRPLIEHTLLALEEAGCSSVLIGTGHLGAQLRPAVSRIRDRVRKMEIEVVDLGETGGNARTARRLWDTAAGCGSSGEPVLVVCGDLLLSGGQVSELVSTYRERGEAAVLVAALGDSEDPGNWIGVRVDARGWVRAVIGHPRDGVTHRLVGAAVLPPSWYRYLADNPGLPLPVQVGGMPPAEFDLSASLALALENGENLAAVEVGAPVTDLDKPWHLLEASRFWIRWAGECSGGRSTGGGTLPPLWSEGEPKVDPSAHIEGLVHAEEGVTIGRNVDLRGEVWIGRNARLGSGALLLGPAVIGRDTVVADYCRIDPFTVIGNGCRVGHAAEVSGILMDGVYAVHYMEVYGVVGRHSDLGAATVCGTLRFDDGRSAIEVRGRTERPGIGSNAVYIGDFCRTGVNVTLLPGRRIGPYSCVGPGVIVDHDIPPETMVLARQEWTEKSWGPERYGW